MEDWQAPEREEVEKPPPWLLTFADVTALMLTFFVMMFAMSQVQSARWNSIVTLLSTSDNPRAVASPAPQADANIGTVQLTPALPLDYLAHVLEEKLQHDAVLKDARIHQLDRQLVVSLPSDLLFLPGKAELQPAAREALFRMGGVVATVGNRIEIGRASCRERVCQYVSISVVAGALKKKKQNERYWKIRTR